MTRRHLIIAAFSAVGILSALAAADRANPPDVSRAQTVSVEVRDRNGVLLRPFLTSDGYWRLKTRPADVSQRYLRLLITYEDQRFATHLGVDALATARALGQFLEARQVVSGASTITMQVARLLEPRPRSIATKLRQMVRAVQLELRYSKDEILGMYLTLAPMGGNLEGVRAASYAYFGKEPKTLTLAEAALLVALPQSPERARPDRRSLDAETARNKVLTRLSARGFIAPEEAEEARRGVTPSWRLALPLAAPHFSDYVGRSKPAQAVILSTLDARLQEAVEQLVSREARFLDDGANVAALIVKTDTREILAYAGGVNYWGPAGFVDLARRPRSPGSALKPFIYGMAFDDLALHPATLMLDEPQTFGDYAPKNFDGGFQGAVTARDALRMSLNVPAVAVLERVGPLRFTLALANSGARLEFPSRDAAPSLPMALGGLGISLKDLTMLYAGIARGGEVGALRATRSEVAPKGARLFGATSAHYLRDILSGASLPDGWAMGQGLKRPCNIAFKTGTSYGYRDAWSIGFSNDYTVGVWTGRADGAPQPDRVGRNDAAPILLRIFDLLPADKHGAPPAPADAIIANNSHQLPPALRAFERQTQAERMRKHVRPPSIAFPPDGVVVSLDDRQRGIELKADGGRAPFTWLVNGSLLGSFDRYDQTLYAPDGEGFSRFTVVDVEGASATSRVRFRRVN
ncbi:MAG: penicillin-binding protein 1C [Alphaproteobacteria bacterium]